MFTGLIDNLGRVVSLRGSFLEIELEKGYDGLEVGESISVNGACLTLVWFSGERLRFQVSPETLKRTNLGLIRPGSLVNLERALRLGDRLGGHIVLGHVDCTARVASISPLGEFREFTFTLDDPSWSKYIVEKGSVAVDGISLTVSRPGDRSFQVMVISHTLLNTNLKERRVGDLVNVEFDIIGKYVERLVSPRGGLTKERLEELGF